MTPNFETMSTLALLDHLQGATAALAARGGRTQAAHALSACLRRITPDDEVLSLAEIANRVAAKHDLTVEDLRGDCQLREAVIARQEAFWLARRQRTKSGKFRFSFPHIGQFFGRDHTTVVHGFQRHERRLAGEPA